MRFTPAFNQEIESVEILQANRQTGLSDVIASGVRMLILPREAVPQELSEVGRSSYRPRFGAVVETPHDELQRLRQIRRADGSVYNIVLVLESMGTMQLDLEQEGRP